MTQGEKEVVRELLDALDEFGRWCESAVVEHGTSWHLTINEHTRYEDAANKVRELVASDEDED